MITTKKKKQKKRKGRKGKKKKKEEKRTRKKKGTESIVSKRNPPALLDLKRKGRKQMRNGFRDLPNRVVLCW